MPTPAEQNNSETTNPETGNSDAKDQFLEEAPEAAPVETTECPNCERSFVGDYCPECGQEAEPSTSLGEVIGGFFRELVDLERGFWPTFVGLTLRPGITLSRYLEGARKNLVTPGRYLAGALVVAYGTDRLLKWGLAGTEPVSGPPSQWNREWSESGMDGAMAVVEYWVGTATGGDLITYYLLIAVALGLLLWRLFPEKISHLGEGLALGGFLTGHLALLGAGISLVHDLVLQDFLWSVLAPVGSAPVPGHGLVGGGPKFWLLHAASAIYLGAVLYLCFGRTWQNYLLGLFTWVWTWLEVVVAFFLAVGLSAFLLVFFNYEVYGSFQLSLFNTSPVWPVILILLVLLLLHGTVETYNNVFR